MLSASARECAFQLELSGGYMLITTICAGMWLFIREESYMCCVEFGNRPKKP
jgi:hypothetical protein